MTNHSENQTSALSPVSAEQEPPANLPQGVQVWEGSSAVVEQGRHWSSAMIWLVSTLFGFTVIWAFTAKVDQTISVRGRLEPTGSVEEVDSPSNGVIRRVFVKDGESVKEGQPLLDVEAQGLTSRRKAVEQSLELLSLQAQSLDVILKSNGNPDQIGPLPALPPVQDPDLLKKLTIARNQTLQISAQLQQIATRLASRRESLRLQQRIARDMEPLYAGGGLPRNTYLTQLNQVQELKAEVATLEEEKSRIVGAAATQLNEVNRQVITLRSELVGLKETIGYRTIIAPISGKVFDNKARPFSVVNTSQMILKIVPENNLQATVEIPNSDIGFVRVGMSASVAVDSFPAGEFGYIKGMLSSVGSDALPPDQRSPQYRFPGVITLKQQRVQSGEQELNLQSGMGVTANIKLRSRPAITIVTDLFTKQFEGLKRFR